MRGWGGAVFLGAVLCSQVAWAGEAWERVERTGELRWGADDAGGAPYVLPDPQKPDRLIGFEIDLMEAVASRLGVKSRLVLVPWDQLVPALLRDDFDLALNGLEITEERRAAIDFTIPYYFFSEQITVRRGETRFATLGSLKGTRVGTLSASLAQSLLEGEGGIEVVPYPSPVESYKDLEIGRVDAVLMDVPIAAWYAGPNPKLLNLNPTVGEGIYAGGVRKDSPVLREKMNAALAELIASGELQKIYQKWNIWNENQAKLTDAAHGAAGPERAARRIGGYFPLLVKGAGMTLAISLISMALAAALGFVLCIMRLYGTRPLKIAANVYIEVIRGTPLLIQLYLLYYGLPNLGIQLNAFVAAVLGMGLNYAAYEAEIYRAGLLSIPKGQEEAARSIGMTTRQTLRFVLVPQAVRTILPPSTNDFIALFKDTSLVSIITVTELTRAYTTAATSTYRFLELGLLTAALYFAMSFPLSLWSRSMEKRRHVALH